MTLLPLRGFVERRLSALIGAEVTLGRLRAFVKKGVVEACDVEVKFDHVAAVRIPRIRAEVSFAGALRKSIVVRTVVLERPVLAIVQRADGTIGMPGWRLGNLGNGGDSVEDARPESREWKLDVSRVLLVDGEVRFSGRARYWAGYEFVAGGALGELVRTTRGFKFTLIVQSPARVDRPAALEEVKAIGEIITNTGVATDRADASIFANVDLGPTLQARLECRSIRTADARIDLTGRLPVPTVMQLLPASLTAISGLNVTSGQVDIRATMTRAPAGTIGIPTLDVGLRDMTMTLVPH